MRLFAVAFVLALIAAACGGDDSGGTTATPPPASSPAPTSTSEVEASPLLPAGTYTSTTFAPGLTVTLDDDRWRLAVDSETELVFEHDVEDISGQGFVGQRQPLADLPTTDAAGKASFALALPDTPPSVRPMKVEALIRLVEAGGRGVERKLSLALAEPRPWIGIRPLFGDTIGEGEVIPGFEEAVVGMNPGESKKVVIPAENAYGPRHEEMVLVVDRQNLPEGVDPQVGQQYQIPQSDGQSIVVTVTDASDSSVTLDGNHPLAGRALTFEIELLEVA